MISTLLVVGLVNALTAVTFAVVGGRLNRRQVASADQPALRAMVQWWWCMTVFLAIQAALVLSSVVGRPSIAAFTVSRYVDGPLLAAAAWGLSFHILYLYTGRRSLRLPLGVYFAAVAVAYDTSVALHPIVSLTPAAWEVTASYAQPLESDPLWTAVLAGVGIPLMAACAAYGSLLRRLARREQKRRVLLVSSGIFLWVAAGLAAQLAGGPLARFVTITVLGLLASITVFLAYFPPAWLRRGDAPAMGGVAAPAGDAADSLYERA